MREQKSECGTGRIDIGRSRTAFAVISAAELPASPTGDICYFTRLFYCSIVDFEVTDGSKICFPTEASNNLPDLFHGSLASHLRDIGPTTVTLVLPNGSASFRSEDS